MNADETRYLELLLAPLDKCADYQPRFGFDRSKGVSLDAFKQLYGSDPFYHWVGLDSELMYAAHKAAGGMTSIYRQLGNGCEQLFRTIIQDLIGLTQPQVVWSCEIEKKDKTKATLTLDARLDLEHIQDEEKKSRLKAWLARAGALLKLSAERISQLRGAVFEARQGYKSADAKRSNADLGFGMNAASENYIPVLAVISTQASAAVLRRYRNNKMLVMTGTKSEDDTSSTFAFSGTLLGTNLITSSSAIRKRCVSGATAFLKHSSAPNKAPTQVQPPPSR